MGKKELRTQGHYYETSIMLLAYLLCTLSSQRFPTELSTVKTDTETAWLVTYLTR